ncbi:MAG: Hsp20/alpha crystallin family protein [Candidatus Sericytochromatia bacterium]
MRLVKWEPVQDVLSLQNQIDRLFSDFWKDSKGLPNLNPPVDVLESKEDYIVKTTLAGINKEDIDISLSNNVLTIKAHKHEVKEDEKYSYYHREISHGSFQRQVGFNHNVDGDNIKAKYENGVLELVIPKIDRDKSRKIVIE